MWHDFSANDADYDYGTEWGLLLERPIANNFLVGIKYTFYGASGHALNKARKSISGQAFDLEKAGYMSSLRSSVADGLADEGNERIG